MFFDARWVNYSMKATERLSWLCSVTPRWDIPLSLPIHSFFYQSGSTYELQSPSRMSFHSQLQISILLSTLRFIQWHLPSLCRALFYVLQDFHSVQKILTLSAIFSLVYLLSSWFTYSTSPHSRWSASIRMPPAAHIDHQQHQSCVLVPSQSSVRRAFQWWYASIPVPHFNWLNQKNYGKLTQVCSA